jgi:hypothetical protein
VALQRVQATIILCRAVVAGGETSFRLSILPGFSPISLDDLLGTAGNGFRSYVLCFLLLRLPIVRSALSHFRVWSLVWTWVLSFFFSRSLAGSFSYIYLLALTCCMQEI